MKGFVAHRPDPRERSGMIHRRTLLSVALGTLPLPALAQLSPAAPEDAAEAGVASRRPARLRTPRLVLLRPGAPMVTLHAGVVAEQGLSVRFSGAGAPGGRILLPSWYGYGRVFQILRLRGRDIVLAAFEGNRGTGVYQEIQAAIGLDDAGVLRILALETLSYRMSGPCHDNWRLDGALRPGAGEGALRYEARLERREPDCRSQRPRAPRREDWTDTLRWDGGGPIMGVPPPANAKDGQRRTAEIRALVAAWLVSPRTTVTLDDVERLRLMEALPDQA